MKEHFNVYHFFAGVFVPAWLLVRQELSAGAKLTYALLAQQANSRGTTQLNFRLQGAALGADEGKLARHLMDLEEVGLVQVSRGNVQTEDIRVFFPRHPWMTGLGPAADVGSATITVAQESIAPRLFDEDSTAAQPKAGHAAAQATGQHPREGRGRRRRRKPQSQHPFEVCLRFVTYQKEVLHHDHIWNVTGLARHIYLSGEQDAEIDAWLAERRAAA